MAACKSDRLFIQGTCATIAWILAVFTALTPLHITAFELKVMPSSNEVALGNFLLLTLDVKTTNPVEINAQWQRGLTEQVDIDAVSPKDSTTHQQFTWRLWPKKAGNFTVPAIEVSDGNTSKKSDPIEVKVILPFEQGSPQLKDVKSAVVIKEPVPMWIWVALAIAGLLALLGLFYWRQRTTPIEVIPPRPAHEIAMERLKKLQSFIESHPGEAQQYYYELSEIFRSFLEQHFGFPASSMTTQELIPALKQRTSYNLEEQQRIQHLCQQSDVIKYAEGLPTRQSMDEDFRLVWHWIEKVVLSEQSEDSEDHAV